MYESIQLPWSATPSPAETLYRARGLVKSRGTVFLLPPSTSTLRSAFNAPPRPQTRMSSGAVALCKHFERGGASSEHGKPHPFWTLPRGSNVEKTAAAALILEGMLDDARWRNVMMLHAGVAVYELRNTKGYGMRWTLELQRKAEEAKDMPSTGKHEDRLPDANTQDQDTAQEALADAENEAGGDEAYAEDWEIKTTSFRGFLEPIAEMNHELELENEVELS
ncbi:MAG: hypothetical protein M1823_006670 [Watsoniomyces obsoletus]|nr:MAG: hypothetical protein M1823_006670 [Watsoniomyces obsoletus]